jgi:hypothetical protein
MCPSSGRAGPTLRTGALAIGLANCVLHGALGLLFCANIGRLSSLSFVILLLLLAQLAVNLLLTVGAARRRPGLLFLWVATHSLLCVILMVSSHCTGGLLPSGHCLKRL